MHMHNIIHQLQWNFNSNNNSKYELNIIGHSMGAAISILYAGCYPEIITGKLVLIENFGQLSKSANEACNSLRKGIDAELKLLENFKDSEFTISPKIYNNINEAIEARLLSVSKLPGNQTMSRNSAESLVKRGTIPINLNNNLNNNSDVPVKFCHDVSLYSPSLYYSTEEQVRSFINCIQCKTLFITGGIYIILLILLYYTFLFCNISLCHYKFKINRKWMANVVIVK